jgi:RNA polymerase sigma-70 factor, ECF subfamily
MIPFFLMSVARGGALVTQSLPPDSAQARLTEIMEVARTGDQKAFTQLYEYYNAPICTYIAHFVGNDEAGRDLAQETFIRAWKGLPKLQGDISFRPWLYRIATNVARTHLQRERLINWLPWRDEQKESTQSVLSVVGPEEQVGEQDCIIQVLATLPRQSRICLLLQHVAGFSQSEIAVILGISAKSVSAYVSRGREQFRLAYSQLKGESLR